MRHIQYFFNNYSLSIFSGIIFVTILPAVILKTTALNEWHDYIPLDPGDYYALFVALLFFFCTFLWTRFNYAKAVSAFFLYTLPVEVLLLITLLVRTFEITNLKTKYAEFDIIAGLWLFSVSAFIVVRYHKKYFTKKNMEKELSLTKNTYANYIVGSILAIIIALHFSFGLYHIGKASYVDERLWTYGNTHRIEKYWDNIIERDWRNTRPSDKPGITLSLLSGPSLLFTTPSLLSDKGDNQSLPLQFEKMFFTLRLPLLFFGSISLIFFYYLVRVWLTRTVALIAIAFIGLSPLLLGMSRIINPDAMLWVFFPMTLLAFLAYLKTTSLHLIYITGILLGLSLLTKYTANLLFLFLFLSMFTYPLFLTLSAHQLRIYLQRTLSAIGVITLTSLMTFYVFYPGTWVKLDRLLIGTLWSQAFLPIWHIFSFGVIGILIDYFFFSSSFVLWIVQKLIKIRSIIIYSIPSIVFGSILFILVHTYTTLNIFNFNDLLSSPKISDNASGILISAGTFFSGFYALLFGMNPIALVGVIIATSVLIMARNYTSIRILAWHIIFFLLIYYIGSVFSSVVPIVRYQIIIYPLIFIFGAIGYEECARYFYKRSRLFSYSILSITIFTGSITLFLVKPFYFSYASEFLPRQQIINPKDMGDGSYEAATYLNSLSDAKNLTIWTDKRGVCIFFIGKCGYSISKKDFIMHGPDYDYYVISSGRAKRTIAILRTYSHGRADYPIRLDTLYNSIAIPVYEVSPGNRSVNYIRIFSKDDVDVWRGYDYFKMNE